MMLEEVLYQSIIDAVALASEHRRQLLCRAAWILDHLNEDDDAKGIGWQLPYRRLGRKSVAPLPLMNLLVLREVHHPPLVFLRFQSLQLLALRKIGSGIRADNPFQLLVG